MVMKLLWSKLMNIDVEHILFQQDGAIPHFTNVTIDPLGQRFCGRLIYVNGDINRRSCDLTMIGLCEKLSLLESSSSFLELDDEIIRENFIKSEISILLQKYKRRK